MKLWSGANFWHQFRARPWKWPAQVLGRVGYCGLMGSKLVPEVSPDQSFIVRHCVKFNPPSAKQ